MKWVIVKKSGTFDLINVKAFRKTIEALKTTDEFKTFVNKKLKSITSDFNKSFAILGPIYKVGENKNKYDWALVSTDPFQDNTESWFLETSTGSREVYGDIIFIQTTTHDNNETFPNLLNSDNKINSTDFKDYFTLNSDDEDEQDDEEDDDNDEDDDDDEDDVVNNSRISKIPNGDDDDEVEDEYESESEDEDLNETEETTKEVKQFIELDPIEINSTNNLEYEKYDYESEIIPLSQNL